MDGNARIRRGGWGVGKANGLGMNSGVALGAESVGSVWGFRFTKNAENVPLYSLSTNTSHITI